MEINVKIALDERRGMGWDWQPVKEDCSEAEDTDNKKNLSPGVLRGNVGSLAKTNLDRLEPVFIFPESFV